MSFQDAYSKEFQRGVKEASWKLVETLEKRAGWSQDAAANFVADVLESTRGMEQSKEAATPLTNSPFHRMQRDSQQWQRYQQMQPQYQQQMQQQAAAPPPNPLAGKPTSGPMGTAMQVAGMGLGGYGAYKGVQAGREWSNVKDVLRNQLTSAQGKAPELHEMNKVYNKAKDTMRQQFNKFTAANPGMNQKQLLESFAHKMPQGSAQRAMRTAWGRARGLGSTAGKAGLLGLGLYGLGRMFG